MVWSIMVARQNAAAIQNLSVESFVARKVHSIHALRTTLRVTSPVLLWPRSIQTGPDRHPSRDARASCSSPRHASYRPFSRKFARVEKNSWDKKLIECPSYYHTSLVFEVKTSRPHPIAPPRIGTWPKDRAAKIFPPALVAPRCPAWLAPRHNHAWKCV